MVNSKWRLTGLRNDRMHWTLALLCACELSACGDDGSERSPNLGARNTAKTGGSAGKSAVAGQAGISTIGPWATGGVGNVITGTSTEQNTTGGIASVATGVAGGTSGTTFEGTTVHLGGTAGAAGATVRQRGGTGGVSTGGSLSVASGSTMAFGGQSGASTLSMGGASSQASGGVAGNGSSNQAGAAGMAAVCSDALVAPKENGGIIGDLTYDSDNQLHVGYVQAVDRYPTHAWLSNGVWQKEVIDVGLPAVGLELEADQADVLHAVAQVTNAAARKALVYAQRSPLGVWTVESALTPNSATVSFYRLYIDADGSPVIIYATDVSSAGHDLFRVRRQASTWTTDKLLTRKTNAAAFSVNLGADGNPWIAMAGELIVPSPNGYMVQAPIGWSAKSLDFVLAEGDTEVLLSEPGGVVLGNGTFWGTESIADIAATQLPMLHLDPDGNVIATFFSNDPNELVSTFRREASGWTNDPTIELGKLHGRASMAASYGRPQASSSDGRLAEFDDPGAYAGIRVFEATRTEYATYDVDVRTKQLSTLRSMITDGHGRVYLAFLQGDEVDLLAENADGSWDRSILPLTEGADVLSLTTDPAGLPTVALATEHAVGYATWVSGAWQTHWLPGEPALGTAVLRRLSIVFGENGAPHVFYLSGTSTSARLWHASGDLTAPQLLHEPVTVDSVLRAHIDANGVAHVVYNGPNLRMARWSKGLWQQAAVANVGALGPSSFVDTSGNVCVGDPAAVPNLKVSCDVAGQLVSTSVASDIGKFIQLIRNPDGKLTALSTTTAGSGATHIYSIDPQHPASEHRTFPLLEAPSVLFDAKGGLRLAHFDTKHLRLYVTRCDR